MKYICLSLQLSELIHYSHSICWADRSRTFAGLGSSPGLEGGISTRFI